MEENGNDFEGDGQTEEEPVEPDGEDESDAILHEKDKSSSPRDNI